MSKQRLNIAGEKIAQIEHGLVVSCQASPGEPLCAPEHIAALALSAIAGGAGALRLEGPENVAFVRKLTAVPIIGLTKAKDVGDEERLHRVYITATLAEAAALAQSGSDVIAIDATARPRPDGLVLSELIERIHNQLNCPVWADVATMEEGIAAAAAGADVISTTLSGYTAATAGAGQSGPDFALLEALSAQLAVPVVLEGKVWHPEEVTRAFYLGAYAVVVGSAITRIKLITRRFVQAIPDRL